MNKEIRGNCEFNEGSPTERFLQLLMANQQRIYAFILGMVFNRSDADDVMQEATIVMWRKFGEFRPGTDFVAWGVTIAKYQVLGFRQKHRSLLLRFSEETLQALEADADSMLSQLDSRLDAMEHCMAKLKGRDRELVQMRYTQDMTVKKVAERIGRSIHTVYKSLGRIHDLLLHCVRRQLMTEGGIDV
ncbi:sigma-70 family RNA polymerase sigma factor [Planctomycetota bacterium]